MSATSSLNLLAVAKNIADRLEAEASRAKAPVAVRVIDVHGNVVLHRRMSGAPAFSIDLSEWKAYTSALVGMRTADLWAAGFPGMTASQGRYCAMAGGAPLASEGQVITGVWRKWWRR